MANERLNRRRFLKLTGAGAGSLLLGPRLGLAQMPMAGAKPAAGGADFTLRMGTGLIELAPDQIISTTCYNGQFPGPLLRLEEGKRYTIDLINETDTPEQHHWHGQFVAVEIDGSAEEGTPFVPARGKRRIELVARPSGFRFYHTHTTARDDLSLGQYNGLVGPVYIEPKENPGKYDQEIFLTLKEFAPAFSKAGDMAMDFLAPSDQIGELKEAGESAMNASLAKGDPHGLEVGYSLFSINGRMLGNGEPIKVKQGERVLFHVLNGSATEIRSLALPGHTFKVLALDGNPVPKPAEVPVLWLGTAERISAIVEMNRPGVWTMGDLGDDDREHGMGIVVEYAGSAGKPVWEAPPAFKWDYSLFSAAVPSASKPDATIEMTFAKKNAAEKGFNVWTINGAPFSMETMKPMFELTAGKRYRWKMRNASDDIHPMHMHRHSFELTKIAGKPTAGIMKDVVMLGGYQEIEVDFTADNPGLTLFHCHMQLHMDFGFMGLFNYV